MGEVDKTLLKAWDLADSVVFHAEGNEATLTFFRRTKDEIFGETEQQRQAGPFHVKLPPGYTEAFFHERFYAKSGNWWALRKLLRVGDELSFRVLDNANGYLEKAEIEPSAFGKDAIHHCHYKGIHNDTLVVTIRRKNKEFVRDMELMHTICPDNTARALR